MQFLSIEEPPFDLPTKHGAPPELTGKYNHKTKRNCSSKREQQISSGREMNGSCCFDVPARVVLYFLSWSGFLVSFMMRNDVSIYKSPSKSLINFLSFDLNGNFNLTNDFML